MVTSTFPQYVRVSAAEAQSRLALWAVIVPREVLVPGIHKAEVFAVKVHLRYRARGRLVGSIYLRDAPGVACRCRRRRARERGTGSWKVKGIRKKMEGKG